MTPIPAKQRRTSARAKVRAQAADRVIGYLRCSTDEQAESGLGLDAQRAAVEFACAAKGWTVTDWAIDEGVSGSVAPADRPAMARALRLLDGGEAGALVAAKVDRIARDLHDLTGLLRRAEDDGWAVVALDLGVDTTTPVGRMLVGILGSVAEWERATIRQRTRDALAAKKAAGARLGRPVSAEAQPARARLRELLHDRLPLATIAATLNAEGYTTATGLQWTWRHVQKTRDSLALDDLAVAWEWQPGDLVALRLRGDSTPTRGTIIRSDRTGVAVEWDDGEVTHVPPDRVAELQRAHHEDVR